MTEKQLEANRRNARKSTGPKTQQGKARASKNALKYGVLAVCPVVPGIESPEDWKKHRDGLITSLAPVGFLEEFLANQAAIKAWRWLRVIRFETDLAEASIATAELDLEEDSDFGSGKPTDPAKAKEQAEEAFSIGELLETLPSMRDKKKLDAVLAVATFWFLSEKASNHKHNISIPGLPDDDAGLDAFDNWTAGLLRKVVEAYAAVEQVVPEDFRYDCVVSARDRCDRAEERECELAEKTRLWELRLRRENRRRVLLEPELLDKVARYESNLERSFFKTLHEIQRLQASRAGAVVPPPAAIDVDMTVHGEEVS